MSSITARDNQTGVDLAAPPSTRGVGAARVFDVPLVRATAESLAGFGRPVADFATAGCDITPFPLAGWRRAVPGTGDEGGCVEGVFTNERRGLVHYSVNVALGRRYVTGWYGDDPAAAAAGEGAAADADDAADDSAAAAPAGALSAVLTHEANYHADGAQVVCARPGGGAFVLLLARAGDDVRPESFRAFFVDPATGVAGVHIDAGTWHQPAWPARGAPRGALLDNRQGRVHSCVAVSFLDEFGGYLRVPLDAAALAAPPPPPPPPPAPPRLAYAIRYVESVPAAVAFYEAAFGLRRRLVAPGDDYAELETGRTALAFARRAFAERTTGPTAPAPRGAPPAPSEVGLVVADVDAALARAVAAGAEPVGAAQTKEWGQRVAYVRDLDGFLVELCD